MSLKERITEDMKTALRAGEKDRLAIVRLMLAAIKQVEVDERKTVSDQGVIIVLTRMVKQGQESISQYDAAGRTDLADKERFELQVIKAYLPEPLTDNEIEARIMAAIEQTGASAIKDMGKVMGILKPGLLGRADMGQVSTRVKALLLG